MFTSDGEQRQRDLRERLRRAGGALACSAMIALAGADPTHAGRGDGLRAIPIRQAGSPSGLGGAFGIDVGPDGRVYVAAPLQNEVLVLDARRGRVLDRIGSDRGVDGPDDLEVGPDGTVYLTSPLTGAITALFPDGTVRQQLVAPGLNPVTVRDDGRVYAAAAFTDRGLFEIDPQLLAPPRALLPDITGLNGFDFGPDGLLYSPDTNTGGIVRIDVDATPPRVESVLPPGTFRLPGAVSFDPDGVLHAIDAAEGRVFRIDLDAARVERLLDVEGTFDNLAFDDSGNLFVTELADGRVLVRRPTGRVRPLTPGRLGRPGIIAPAGVAVDEHGIVYLADVFSLRKLAPRWPLPLETAYVRFVDSISRPFSVDVAAGRVLTTTFGVPGIVQVLDARTGAILETTLDPAVPSNAIFLADGDRAVAQLLTGSVVRASDGAPLLSGLLLPLGLARQGDALLASDFLTGTVWRAAPGAAPSIVAQGLQGPEGIAVFEKWLIVAETVAGRVTAIDLETGQSAPLAEVEFRTDGLPTGVPPFGALTGVAVDERHALLYVALDSQRQVLAFRLSTR